MFDVSLERTGAGYFDFYLLHNLGGGRTEVFEKSGAWEFVSEMKEKGLVRSEGKDYVMQDGDVTLFRFNV